MLGAKGRGNRRTGNRRTMEDSSLNADAIDIGPNGGVTVSTESLTVERHAGG